MSTFLCPNCGSDESSTIDSRPRTYRGEKSFYVRRRRKCADCGHKITTFESTQRPGDVSADEGAESTKTLARIRALLAVDA